MNNIEVGKLIGRRKKVLGALGETLVVKHLKNKGFSHVQSNFQMKCGELDVIMKRDGKIHFIEVKTVSRENLMYKIRRSMNISGALGDKVIRETELEVNHETFAREAGLHMPEENVSKSKLHKISRMISIYMGEQGMQKGNWQFDVAVVLLDRKSRLACIKLINNVQLAG